VLRGCIGDRQGDHGGHLGPVGRLKTPKQVLFIDGYAQRLGKILNELRDRFSDTSN
jgi:hypothetical protein